MYSQKRMYQRFYGPKQAQAEKERREQLPEFMQALLRIKEQSDRRRRSDPRAPPLVSILEALQTHRQSGKSASSL